MKKKRNVPNIVVQRSGEGRYGVIEPDDRSWIIFLDAAGRPTHYWSKRSSSGAVVGHPVVL